MKFKFIKPPWISYNSIDKGKENIRAIMSLDLHPSGSKLATGGQQETGGLVAIWNMLPVRSVSVAEDGKTPKMLFHSAKHQACVNCVRWNPKGTFLASAGDDRVIMLWMLASGSYGEGGQTFRGEKIVENWRCIHFLRGHTGDIQDISWHPSGNWLASASVDNLVIVWRAPQFGAGQQNQSHFLLHRITGHDTMVKAICWDPIGRYLATLGDEPSLRIWRIQESLHSSQSPPTEETCLKGQPFHTGNALLLRLSWSPDGSHLVVPQTVNNGFPTAQFVSRSGWKMDMDFVGHRQTVTCVRHNPCVFEVTNPKAKNPSAKRVLCLAVAGKDRSVSVWRTDRMRPLLAIHQMFTQAILDFTWSSDGCELAACSADGTVAIIMFEKAAMGRALSEKELTDLHISNYGQSGLRNFNNLTPHCAGDLLSANAPDMFASQMIPEAPEIVHLQKQTEALLAQESQLQVFSKPKKPSSSAVATRPTKQIENLTKDGKRRITPAFLSSLHDPPAIENGEDKSKQGISLSQVEGNNSTATDHSMTPTSEEQVPLMEGESGSGKKVKSPPPPTTTQSTSTLASTSVELIQKVPDSSMKFSTASANKTPTKLPPAKKRRILMNDKTETVISGLPGIKSSSTSKPCPPNAKRAVQTNKGVNDTDKLSTPNATKSQSISQENGTAGSGNTPVHKAELFVYPLLGLNALIPGSNNSTLRCSTTNIIVKLQASSSGSNLFELVASYGGSNSPQSGSQVQALWKFMCPAKLVRIMLIKQFLYLTDEHGRLHILTIQGDRVKLPIPLGAPLSYILLIDKILYIVNRSAQLLIWSLESMQIVQRRDLKEIVPSNNVRVKSISLAHSNAKVDEIVLVWSSGSAYLWDTQCACWMEICNAEDSLLQKFRQMYFSGAGLQGPVSFVQTQALARSLNQPRASSNNSLLSMHDASLASGGASSQTLHSANPSNLIVSDMFQSYLLVAEALHSAEEYKHWLKTWVRMLVNSSDITRLRRICDDLLGPTHHGSQSAWKPEVMGLSKRALLKDVLPLFGLNLKLQRLYMEVKDQLDS